jgi:hypothetical protein
LSLDEVIVREISDPSGNRRVLLVRRADGRFTYRCQERDGEDWGPMSLDMGVYDSADTAETEARQREPWLKKLFH